MAASNKTTVEKLVTSWSKTERPKCDITPEQVQAVIMFQILLVLREMRDYLHEEEDCPL
jgi:hypothetical protein